MLAFHSLDWSTTQTANCRGYLLSPTGRFQNWCRETGVVDIDDLTTDALAGLLAALGDRSGPGLKASTLTRMLGHFRALARFQAATLGYGNGLRDIDRIPK
ncbi:MAG: hypothetical protein ACRD1G_04705, partial [Acidimicrobiales bacterium]